MTAENQRKKGRSKRQISIRLHASKMKKVVLLIDFECPKVSVVVNAYRQYAMKFEARKECVPPQ